MTSPVHRSRVTELVLGVPLAPLLQPHSSATKQVCLPGESQVRPDTCQGHLARPNPGSMAKGQGTAPPQPF